MNSKAQVKEKRGRLVQFHVCMPFAIKISLFFETKNTQKFAWLIWLSQPYNKNQP